MERREEERRRRKREKHKNQLLSLSLSLLAVVEFFLFRRSFSPVGVVERDHRLRALVTHARGESANRERRESETDKSSEKGSLDFDGSADAAARSAGR